MVQDVPNLRAHVESRAQRPLWIVVAIIAIGAVWYAFWGPGFRHGEEIRRNWMLIGAHSFANGLSMAGMSQTQTNPSLARSPEAAFLRAVVHRHAGSDATAEEARQWLDEAAQAGIPGADTLLGWVLLDQEDCASCTGEAVTWFEHALAGRADRDARLGLATALARLGHAEEARGHCDALLVEEVQDTVRLRALVLRAAVTPGPNAAAAYVEEAARQGFAEAQFALWRDHLPQGDRQALLWLAMAALQGYAPAIKQIKPFAAPPDGDAGERLLAIAQESASALGKAALWCGRQSGKDGIWERACRLKALEGHLACGLPKSVLDTLGLHGFEQSQAYSQCRTKALAGAQSSQTEELSTPIEADIVEAKDLFLANRLMEALDALDERTLARSGEANLLAGLIHLYRPRADLEAAKRHFARAGTLGIGHAFAILGTLIFNEGCSDCVVRAAAYYKRALEWGDDPAARFGLALALEEQGRRAESLKAFEELLAEEGTPRFWRIWAASFVSGMINKSDPRRGEMLLSMAATAGFPEAQAYLGLYLLHERRDAEAEVWLRRIGRRSECSGIKHCPASPRARSCCTRVGTSWTWRAPKRTRSSRWRQNGSDAPAASI
jgi:TPR repeat protein